MRKLLYGLGVCDKKTGSNIDGRWVKLKSYQCWADMLRRCYSDKFHTQNPTYIGCSVSPEWLTYSVFKEWHDKNYIAGFELDKDLLIKGNKEYSPNNCVFIPRKLNSLFNKRESRRGSNCIGVLFDDKSGLFRARCSINGAQKHIGSYQSEIEAGIAYQEFKTNHALSEFKRYKVDHCNNKPLMKLILALEGKFLGLK